MDEILEPTYGIMVYQEQVMRIFNRLGGIPLRAAYGLIKAISKKKADVIAKFKPKFIEGAVERGLAEDKAKEVFGLILKFGGYGFNKSHSTRYAVVAYQTAYMKTYHPVEYMAALLTFDAGNTEKLAEYIDECHKVLLPDGTRGIEVLPPDVNASGKDFTPTKRKVKRIEQEVIRFGLAAVRGVGEKAVETVIEERESGGRFESLFDFCERVDGRAVGKSTLDALIRCGGFGGVHKNRAATLAALERAFEVGQQAQDDKRTGQTALFGAPDPSAAAPATDALPKTKEFEANELLKFEKELLGFYISDHPLAQHQAAVDRYTTATTAEAAEAREGAEVVVGCMISAVRGKVAKSGKSAGKKWAILEFEDLDGKIEGMCFADCFEDISRQYPDVLKNEQIVFVRGSIDKRREQPCLIVRDVIPVAESAAKLTTAIKLDIDPLRHTPEMLVQVKPILQKHRGGCDVYLQVASDKVCGDRKKLTLRFDNELRVRPSAEMVGEVEHVLGHGSVGLVGDGLRRMKRLRERQQEAAEAATAQGAADAEGIADELEESAAGDAE